MECKKCGAKWEANVKVEKCPFCGSLLREDEAKVFTEIRSAINYVVSEYGKDLYLDGRRFFSILSDYVANVESEKRLLKICLDSEVYKPMVTAADDEIQRKMIFQKAVADLKERFFIDNEKARTVLSWIADSLGWNTEKSTYGKKEHFAGLQTKTVCAQEPPASDSDFLKILDIRKPLLKRAFMFLEDKDFFKAEAYCERVLDEDPEDGNAYFCKLLTDYRITGMEAVDRLYLADFENNVNFCRAKQFAKPALSNRLEVLAESNRLKYQRLALSYIVRKVYEKKCLAENQNGSIR